MIAGSSRWTLARTVVAATGLGFAAASLGVACLDHFAESVGACETLPGAGSPLPTADCGTSEAGTTSSTGTGSGFGSAVP